MITMGKSICHKWVKKRQNLVTTKARLHVRVSRIIRERERERERERASMTKVPEKRKENRLLEIMTRKHQIMSEKGFDIEEKSEKDISDIATNLMQMVMKN